MHQPPTKAPERVPQNRSKQGERETQGQSLDVPERQSRQSRQLANLQRKANHSAVNQQLGAFQLAANAGHGAQVPAPLTRPETRSGFGRDIDKNQDQSDEAQVELSDRLSSAGGHQQAIGRAALQGEMIGSATAQPVMQRFRRVGGASYHDYNALTGCNYRILREFHTQNYRIQDIGAGAVLAPVLAQADAAQLALFMGNFHAAQAGNLDQVMAALLASLGAGGSVIAYFAPLRVVARSVCQPAGVLANTSFSFWQRVGGTQHHLFNVGANDDLGVVLTAAHVGNIQAVFGLLNAQGVDNLDDMVVALDKASSLGIPAEVTVARLNAIEQNLMNVVNVRIQADHAAINAMVGGTLDPVFANAFQSIEIPGSDPHKGGQVVVFVNYTTLAGGALRVVYKPSDLTLDALLYSSAASVAQELGTDVADYEMLPMVDAAAGARLHDYGYLEFVASGGPANAADTQDVFRSLGANLAMAYVFGLRDIHQENFILLNNAIQIIDMEAGTGTFTGFDAMELDALPTELYKRIASGYAAAGLSLNTVQGWMPNAGALRAQMLLGFSAKLVELDPADAVHGAAVTAHVTAAANARTRFVPFPTAALQALVARFQGAVPLGLLAGPMLANWNQEILTLATNETVAAGNPPGLQAQMLALLQAPATQAAVHAGDVPFWSRVGNAVSGEDGVVIVAAMNHPRLDTVANNLANSNVRRAPANAGQASTDFVGQAIPLMGDPSAAILDQLRIERIKAGFGPPNY